jgi:replication factor C subunit 3/5
VRNLPTPIKVRVGIATDCFLEVLKLKTDKGLALTDILTTMHEFCCRLEIPAHCRVFLMDKMADLEYKLNLGATEKIQLGALVGTMRIVTDLAKK